MSIILALLVLLINLIRTMVDTLTMKNLFSVEFSNNDATSFCNLWGAFGFMLTWFTCWVDFRRGGRS